MGHNTSHNAVHVAPAQDTMREHFDIVWLHDRDQSILENDNVYSQQLLFLRDYHFNFFQNYSQCYQHLSSLPTNATVILIAERQLEKNIDERIQRLCQVKVIFIIHSIALIYEDQDTISSVSLKIKHVQVDQLNQCIRLFEARFLRNTKEFFSIDIFNRNCISEFSSNEINGRFLYTQLLIDILLRMEPKYTDKDELIIQCTEFYSSVSSELDKIRQFHLEYCAEKVLEWYTRDAFVYRLLNKALRTQNIDLLFLFRFILQDMKHQLKCHQLKSRAHLFRAQIISKDEWNQLSQATNHYITMNSFLSTTFRRDVAEIYMRKSENDDEVPVLFEIETDPKLADEVLPYANISEFSQFPEEEEVLFMAGSVFRIINVIHGELFCTVYMELCSKNDNVLKSVFETLSREYGGESVGNDREASLNSFGIVLFNMERYDTADRFFRRIYHESSEDDSNRIRYCMNIGNAAFRTNRYEDSAVWCDRALALCKRHESVGQLVEPNVHLVRGNLYSKLNRRDKALESYNKALTMYQQRFGEYHPRIAMCYFNIAGCFDRWFHYATAVSYYERALYVGEQTLSELHPDLIVYNLGLADVLINLRHRDLERALNHTKRAFDIAEKTLPNEHTMWFSICTTMEEIYRYMGDEQNETIWFEKLVALQQLQVTENQIELKWNTKQNYMCTKCHRPVWIYYCFECMKNTRINCLIFHNIPSGFEEISRYCCHY